MMGYLMRAEILSKMYWSKLGLLGFFEITPKIATSRCRVFSNPRARDERAVIMTLIIPALFRQKSMDCNSTQILQTFHDVVVLGYLFRRTALLYFLEQSINESWCKLVDIGL
jgi:hypothetical protein